jgi:hypothetical protein
MDRLMDDGRLVWTKRERVTVVDPYDGQEVTFWNRSQLLNSQLHLVNPPGPERDYDALEITVNRRNADNWQFRASHVWQVARGLFDLGLAPSMGRTGLCDNPNARISAEGRLNDEHRHRLRLNWIYRGPWGLNTGVYFQWLSGRRYSRLVRSEDLGLELNQGIESIIAGRFLRLSQTERSAGGSGRGDAAGIRGHPPTARSAELAGRRPRLSLTLIGSFLLRLAERQFRVVLSQVPSRLTRETRRFGARAPKCCHGSVHRLQRPSSSRRRRALVGARSRWASRLLTLAASSSLLRRRWRYCHSRCLSRLTKRLQVGRRMRSPLALTRKPRTVCRCPWRKPGSQSS